MISSTFRAAAHARIAAAIPQVDDRVFQAHTPSADTVKPFVVFKLGDDSRSDSFAFDTGFEVWLYAHGSYVTLDTLAAAVVEDLHEGEIDGYEIEFAGAGADFMDEAWQAIGRRLDFIIPTIT